MQQIRVATDAGSGRVFLLLHEEGAYSAFAIAVASALQTRARVVRCECPAIGDSNWGQLTDSLRELLRMQGVRQCSLIGFGAASAVVQNFVLTEPRFVRTLVLVDAETRPHPTVAARLTDGIEAHLPLGLPLRMRSLGFDAKPFLHRIRCPTLIVVTGAASHHARSEAQQFLSAMPTAWEAGVSGPNAASELSERVVQFQEVPARCPQKRNAA